MELSLASLTCAIFVKLYLSVAKISLISIHLDEFAKLSSTKLIYWQIQQTLVPPIFCHLFLSNLHILCPAYTRLCMPNLKKNRLSSLRDMLLKLAQFSSHFSSSHRFNTTHLNQTNILLLYWFPSNLVH